MLFRKKKFRHDMVFDWQKNPKKAKRNGINIELIDGKERICYLSQGGTEYCTFRNFPDLYIQKQVLSCTFENCGTITFCTDRRYPVYGCTFEQVKKIELEHTYFDKCKLRNMYCDSRAVLSASDSLIDACLFENIKLSDDAFIISSDGTSAMSRSNFKNIVVPHRVGNQGGLACSSNRLIKSSIDLTSEKDISFMMRSDMIDNKGLHDTYDGETGYIRI